MKLIPKTFLRRATSEPELPPESSQPPSNKSTMIIDLADRDTLPALRALGQDYTLQQQVYIAHINAKSCVWYGRIKIDIHALIEVFMSLSELPNLQSLSVDLANLQVPVAVLTTLLKGAKALRELDLKNLDLVGSTHALQEALQSHTQLTSISFLQCRGNAIRSLVTKLPCLKRIELRNSAVGSSNRFWASLGESITLQSLTLHDIPGLKTEHILAFTDALSNQHKQGNSTLQELHIACMSSAVNGQECADAVVDLLLAQRQPTIKTLTLKFGETWTTAGQTTTKMLLNVFSITSLCVRLAGKDITAQALEILDALKINATLKCLKLCIERDQAMDGPLDEAILQSLETLLQSHNHSLQNVVVLDEGREKYSLTPAIEHKLALNATGLPALLHNNALEVQYIHSMIQSKDNLDAVYFALYNQPGLLLDLPASSRDLLTSSARSSENNPRRSAIIADKPRRRSATARLLKLLRV